MKKLLAIGVAMLFSCMAKAQDTTFIAAGDRAYTEIFDSLARYLIPHRIPHGILYDRVYPWSDLLNWQDGDTVWQYRGFQAWYDLERANVDTAYVPRYETMRDSVDHKLSRNLIPVIGIRSRFGYITEDELDNGSLSFVEGFLTDNSTETLPYDEKLVTIGVLPVGELIQGVEYGLTFDPELMINTTGETIDRITVRDLTNNEEYILDPDGTETLEIDDTGDVWVEIEIKTSDDGTYTSTQEFPVRQSMTTGTDCTRPQKNRQLVSDIPFQGYDESIATTSIANYEIFYRFKPNSESECENKLLKPLIILDGYDPQDKRDINFIYTYYLSYDNNGTPKLLGDELRSDEYGYDIIILNFPIIGMANTNYIKQVASYNGSGFRGYVNRDGRDGGTDFIERNAFLLEELIEEINDSLAANGSDEDLVIIGPSMGGLISRYALAYMEKKYDETNADSFLQLQALDQFRLAAPGSQYPRSRPGGLSFLRFHGPKTSGFGWVFQTNVDKSRQTDADRAVPASCLLSA